MMHIKVPEFTKAKDAIHFDSVAGVIDLRSALLEDFWCDGFAYLGHSSAEDKFYVEAKLVVDDRLIVSSGEVFCEEDRQSITSAYNRAIKELKARYTEWVYKNILDNALGTPAAALK